MGSNDIVSSASVKADVSGGSVKADDLRHVILTRWPDRFSESELQEDTELGAEGLGLDSVEIAELIVTCEDRSGSPLPETLFTEGRLTVGRVSRCFWREP